MYTAVSIVKRFFKKLQMSEILNQIYVSYMKIFDWIYTRQPCKKKENTTTG